MEIIENRMSGARIPPQSLEAETSLLGAMLLDKDAISNSIEILGEGEVFYRGAHQRIYQAILDLYEKNEPVDIVTLTESLKERGDLEAIGGTTYLTTLLNSVASAANAAYYARIVKEKGTLRGLIKAADQISNLAYEEEGDVPFILDKSEQLIFNVFQARISRGFVSLKDMLHDSFEVIEELARRKEHITGVPTGFIDLDNLTSGFQPSDLIIIAGRPSMGKSSLALNIVQYAGVKTKVPTAIFSLEMSREQVVQRLLCAEARVDAHKLRTGYLSDSDWPKLTTAAGVLSETPIYIDDSPAISVLELRAKARRLKAKHNLGLIVIDYLQLMQGRTGSESRQQEVSEISRNLKSLARELNIPVVALSQLSRAVEARTERRPQLSDLRESGAIEQDADVVGFVYREELYKPDDEEVKGKAELIIGKQRNGPTGVVKLAFIKKYTKFENYREEEHFE
ncbi:replicative DNA helicase [bacterium]|nr:replicative DNA helicase [bacterium]